MYIYVHIYTHIFIHNLYIYMIYDHIYIYVHIIADSKMTTNPRQCKLVATSIYPFISCCLMWCRVCLQLLLLCCLYILVWCPKSVKYKGPYCTKNIYFLLGVRNWYTQVIPYVNQLVSSFCHSWSLLFGIASLKLNKNITTLSLQGHQRVPGWFSVKPKTSLMKE